MAALFLNGGSSSGGPTGRGASYSRAHLCVRACTVGRRMGVRTGMRVCVCVRASGIPQLFLVSFGHLGALWAIPVVTRATLVPMGVQVW